MTQDDHNDDLRGMQMLAVVLPLAGIVLCVLLCLLLFVWLPAASAQEATPALMPHEYPHDVTLYAVYPDGNTEDSDQSYWAYGSPDGMALTVDWEQYGHYIPDDSGKWYVTGTADELPGAVIVFVSNGVNHHGSGCWVYWPDGVGG